MPLGLRSYVCRKLSTKPQHSFLRLPIWTKAYLVQQTRLWIWPTQSPVVPLVCNGPMAGVKRPFLDRPRRHWTTSHVNNIGRTMIRPPYYFATSATIATTKTAPLSLVACNCIMNHGFVSPLRAL